MPSAAGLVWTMKFSAAIVPGGRRNGRVLEHVPRRTALRGLGTYLGGRASGRPNDAPILYASCGDATHAGAPGRVSNAPYEIVTTSDAVLTRQVIGPPPAKARSSRPHKRPSTGSVPCRILSVMEADQRLSTQGRAHQLLQT